MNFDFKEVKRRANNNWFSILNFNGVSDIYLKNSNGPCPFCGGKDRWRWDDKNGDGGGFCHQCDAKGNGFSILAKWLGLEGRANFPKLLQVVAETISYTQGFTVKADSGQLSLAKSELNKKKAFKIWNNARPLHNSGSCMVGRYLTKRGLNPPYNTNSLRVAEESFYRDGKLVESFPTMIAKIVDCRGNFMAVHRTYLFPCHGGEEKAVYDRKMLGSVSGGAIHFGEPNYTLHVAEGIETALAITKVFPDAAVWSALSAGNMARIDLPAELKELHIWADLDANKVGEIAAHKLARRAKSIGLEVFVHVPSNTIPNDKKSWDWLDEYVANIKESENV